MKKLKRLLGACAGMLWQMKKDPMLLLVSIAPVFAGLLIRFGLPYVQGLLLKYTSLHVDFAPYYPLADLCLLVLPPLMFSFVTAMVVLEETDDHVAGYLCVTPLGTAGYLTARIGLPGGAGFVFSLLIFRIFSLSDLSFWIAAALSLAAVFQGFLIAFTVHAISSNKLEGMAVTKLSGFLLLGLPLPFFADNGFQYALSALPTFWMGKAAQSGNGWYLTAALALSALWMAPLLRRLMRKFAFFT